MSLFECIDSIDSALTSLSKKESFVNNQNLFFKLQHSKASKEKKEQEYQAKKQQEIAFLKRLRHRLTEETEAIETNNNSHLITLLDDCLPEIKAFLKDKAPIASSQLKAIYIELLNIVFKQAFSTASNLTESEYKDLEEKAALYNISFKLEPTKITKTTQILQKYHGEKYKIADIQQDKEPLGTLDGACYGIITLMANHEKSPYYNIDAPRLTINRTVYEAQENQKNETLDQRFVKKHLLTRRHFCSNKEQQAKEILAYAKDNFSKDLLLTSSGLIGKHACYLRIQVKEDKTQEIWYMDPNYGAFRLNTEAEFIELHSTISKICDFTQYQLQEMTYDPSNTKTPEFSFSDIWFVLSTGSRYIDHSSFIKKEAMGLYIASLLTLDTLLTMSPFLCVSAFFPPIAAVAASLLIATFMLTAVCNGYTGILGPVQFFKECLHQMGNIIHPQTDEPNQENTVTHPDPASKPPK
ncbi:MAG: hypothetical protein K0U37_05680 [Gammaproteobacteria bacterium]|nr:hypothetical protein [Gammaproteobacteria bacterium]